MSIVDEKNITDINRIREKLGDEQLSKVIEKKQMSGFLNQMKLSAKPSGIILNYDVDEVKNIINNWNYGGSEG